MGSFGLLLIRGIVGFVMFYHGAQKLFGWFGGKGIEGFLPHVPDMGIPNIPLEAWAYAAAIAEFGGGILLMIGLATRIAALFVAATMAVAVFKVHSEAFLLPDGMEYALTLGIVALGLIFTGPGRLALDYFFRRRPADTPPPRKK